MKHDVESFLALRRLGLPTIAALLAMSLAAICQGAVTDIASTPIVTTTAALVKPNIMLLMDASGSMGRTHMPDEVETQTLPTSVGYKSSQCNILYYNPTASYLVPKGYDGVLFPAQPIDAARYAGFGDFYSAPDLSTKDLRSQFVAYDPSTLEVPSPFPDTPQAGYYFVYSGPQTLNFASAPCTDVDTSSPSVAGTFPASGVGGGTWTKVLITSRPTSEQQNFAIWYSYYRTRIALIKSAASLAFAPLNDTKRVGFITVQPKASPGAAGIAGVTGNWPRYLPIAEFSPGAGAQKELWFRKLFSQSPGGASPAREGLARVGRYYAGLEDSINTNMPATGAADPVQYSCQQNFTIMTTDGYWNGQTESRGSGLYGGGLQLDGVTKVGEQDGDLGDPYSPRPMWDGSTDSIHVITNKNNAYTDNLCSLGGRYRSTWQTQRELTSTTKDTTRTTKRTVQFFEAKSQAVATTVQTTFTDTHDFRTTEQFALRKLHYSEEKYQHYKSQEQTTKITEQWELTTSQAVAQTFQTLQVDTHVWKTEEQWQTEKSQSVERTTQYAMKVDQYKYGRRQVYKHQYQTVAKIGDDEHGVPTEGPCVESTGVHCEIVEVFPTPADIIAGRTPQTVDPNTCTTGPGPTVSDEAHGFLKTTCIDGPAAVPYAAVSSCPTGVTPASSGNSWTETRCDFISGTPTPFDGTCVVGAPTQDLAFFIYTCSRPPANNQDTGVASCSADIAASGPLWITTTCAHPAATNFPPTPGLPCTPAGPQTDSNYVTTTCTKSINTSGYVASCVPNDGTLTPFIKVTCGATEVVSSTAVASASCTPGTFGTIARSCPKTPAGPNAVAKPVQTCSDGATSGDPFYYETQCTYPSATNQTGFQTPALCGTPGVTLGTDPSWITRDCHKPSGANNTSVFADPRFCIQDDGSAPPYLKVDCNTVETMAPIAVAPSTCPIGTTYDGPSAYLVTKCVKHGVSPPTDVAACTATDPEVPPYIVTTCGPVFTDTPVASCTLGATYLDGVDTVTCVKPSGGNNSGPTQVPTCTAQSPADTNSYVTVSCAGSVTTPEVAIAPASCSAPPYSSQAYLQATRILTCYNRAAGSYPSPTFVPACSAGTDGGTLITTICTYPPANNYAATPVAPCGEGTFHEADEVTRVCSKTDTPEFVRTSLCPADIPQSGTGPAIYCSTTPTFGTSATSCAVGDVDSVSPFDTTTDCHPVVTSAMADYAGVCTDGATGTPGETARCSRRAIDVLVSDAGCVDGTNAGSGLITECTAAFGSGHRYSVITTTTVTTMPFSGSVAAGAGASVTTNSGSSLVDGVCYPTEQTFTAQPVPPPPGSGTTCASGPAYPCTTVTATSGGSENSLADVSQYYYKTDLRSGLFGTIAMTNDPLNGGVPPAGSGPEDDNAPHQHMTTFVVALGVSGTLNYRPDYFTATTGDFAEIRTGPTKNWPIWPDPTLTYVNPDDYNNPKSIDDYWHTAVNGRGRYFAATDPTSVIEGLADALAKIDDRLASGTADSVSTLQPTAGNNFAYSTSYKSGVWEGDVEARLIDPATGVPGAPIWKAKDLLGPRELAACDSRQIYLLRGNVLANFTWNTKLCVFGTPTLVPDGLLGPEQLDFGLGSLSQLSQWAFMTSAQKTAAQDDGLLVSFIRGQRANEGFQIGSATKFFRKRGAGVVGEGILGDIVDSQPVYVGQPFADYHENDYTTFKATPRTPMLYVGANDGMLHAFYASVDLLDSPALHGQEAWAVIPSAVLPNLYKLADDNYKRDGHQFYVDATPAVGDVWTSGTGWRTILVGGLGAGGKGYYALDVSSPGALPTPLWEFKQDPGTCPAASTSILAGGMYSDCNIGLTFGKPIITKLAGEWVVILTSGYNNNNGVSGDGGGYVYVLRALTGELKYKIATGVGSAGTPSGLAQLNNFVDNVDIDNTTLRAYGGDVLGNIWRFDFTTLSATLLGTAKDASNVIEPITIRPELAEIDGKPFVLVGTGRLLGASDVTDTQKQSVYGLRDPLTAGPGPLYPDPLRDALRPMKIAQTGLLAGAVRTVSCTGSAGDCARNAGWVLDLPEAGERVNVEMKLVLGSLVFASNVPGLVPCSVGGHSWFNQVDFRTAEPIPGAITSQFLADSLNVGFNVLQLAPAAGQQNPTYTGLFRQSRASNVNVPIHPPQPTPIGRRISWREIAQ
ncbi:MAG: PilC/PilY family type IV pilus protein [Pseudomonadota bacterium]|nr:PilC/PilY family type IV pilus protein [Pseudomonadota bacterium]